MIELESRHARHALKAISENISKVSEDALKQAGAETIERVRSRTPVRTGRLARGHRMKMLDEKTLVLFNEVEYARAVEFGRSGMEPKPHWRPALEAAKKEIPKRYAEHVQELADR